jgi:hypothetical protein
MRIATYVAALSSFVLLIAVPRLHAQDDEGNSAHCSQQTLKGSYGKLYTGFVRDFPDPGQNPIVIQARDIFDGEGHVTETGSSMISGTTQFDVTASGTYTVNPDCSGSLELTGVAGQKFQIVKHGTEILGIITTDSFTISFRSEKQ